MGRLCQNFQMMITKEFARWNQGETFTIKQKVFDSGDSYSWTVRAVCQKYFSEGDSINRT